MLLAGARAASRRWLDRMLFVGWHEGWILEVAGSYVVGLREGYISEVAGLYVVCWLA